MEFNLLAGERGPPFAETSQIKNWKVLHIRFIEPGTARPDASNRQRDRLDKYYSRYVPVIGVVGFCKLWIIIAILSQKIL